MNAAAALPLPVLPALAQAFRAAGATVRAAGTGVWTVTRKDRSVLRLTGQVMDDFLLLKLALAQPPAAAGFDLLKANQHLGGLVKFAGEPDGAVALRADIPLGPDGDPAIRIQEACRGFVQALADSAPPERVSANAAPERALPDLASLCEAAGWPPASQHSPRCSVALETRRGARTALVAPAGAGVRVSTDLTDWESLSPPGRDALALFLLSVNARLRLARASVTEDAAGGAAQLEVGFDSPPAPFELNAACAALSVGADLCGPEAAVLPLEPAASAFLSVRGGPRTACDPNPSTKGLT